MKNTRVNVMVKTAMLSVIAYIIMLVEFPLPPFPPFLNIDLSDIPGIIGGFALGPMAGVTVQLIKNLLHFIIQTSTGGVGELGNFIVGASYIVTATYFYKKHHSKKGALIGCLIGTVVMAITGGVVNRFILLPFFSNLMPIETIIEMGAAVFPFVNDLTTMAIFVIVPFNFIKGVLMSLVTIIIYKKVSPILKGR